VSEGEYYKGRTFLTRYSLRMLAVFLLVFWGVLFGAHALLAVSVIHFFDIVSSVQRFWLVICTIGLSGSFLATSLLVRWQDVALTRFFYMWSGFWLGLLVQLLIATALIWLIILIAPRIGWVYPNTALLASVFFGIALIVSFFGMWNAFHPQVKEITVQIPGLPDTWKGKRIVQLSDIHLGEVYREDFLRGIVGQINKLNPVFVVITGDLFDGMNDHLDALAAPLADMQADKGVYFVTGNHETYIGSEIVRKALGVLPVRILENEVVDIDGLALIGLSYPDRGMSFDPSHILEKIQASFRGKPNILLFHAPTHVNTFKEAGIHLQLSGHTHLGQLFPFFLVTKSMYRGHDYGLYQDGDYTLYTTNGVGTWGPPMRVGNTPEIVVITLQ
ncbi:MAG: Metallophosphoesterase, partial [Patescibacteria group bacterium]|nr:Metallophosphoesterase [Patescibacteria group bacterium]